MPNSADFAGRTLPHTLSFLDRECQGHPCLPCGSLGFLARKFAAWSELLRRDRTNI